MQGTSHLESGPASALSQREDGTAPGGRYIGGGGCPLMVVGDNNIFRKLHLTQTEQVSEEHTRVIEPLVDRTHYTNLQVGIAPLFPVAASSGREPLLDSTRPCRSFEWLKKINPLAIENLTSLTEKEAPSHTIGMPYWSQHRISHVNWKNNPTLNTTVTAKKRKTSPGNSYITSSTGTNYDENRYILKIPKTAVTLQLQVEDHQTQLKNDSDNRPKIPFHPTRRRYTHKYSTFTIAHIWDLTQKVQPSDLPPTQPVSNEVRAPTPMTMEQIMPPNSIMTNHCPDTTSFPVTPRIRNGQPTTRTLQPQRCNQQARYTDFFQEDNESDNSDSTESANSGMRTPNQTPHQLPLNAHPYLNAVKNALLTPLKPRSHNLHQTGNLLFGNGTRQIQLKEKLKCAVKFVITNTGDCTAKVIWIFLNYHLTLTQTQSIYAVHKVQHLHRRSRFDISISRDIAAGFSKLIHITYYDRQNAAPHLFSQKNKRTSTLSRKSIRLFFYKNMENLPI